jgi:hypothetical protein
MGCLTLFFPFSISVHHLPPFWILRINIYVYRFFYTDNLFSMMGEPFNFKEDPLLVKVSFS